MGKRRKKSDVEAGPNGVRGWRIALLVLCAVGICLAADLIRLHVKVHTDPDYHSYCAMSERVNCETVAASSYSVFFGLPTSVWGSLIYVAIGGLAVWGLRSSLRVPSWPFGMLFWINLAGSAISVYLYSVSHFVIRSICIVCAGSYLVNFSMLFISLVELRRNGTGPFTALAAELRSIRERPGAFVVFAGVLVVLGIGLHASIPPYWAIDHAVSADGLAVGRTSEGLHWIGARQPVVEIVEFSDYQCPHCWRGHTQMRALVRANPDIVRLVHRNYPLDQACNVIVKQPFHPWACEYARLALCAGEQGRFWEANDYLFEQGRRPDKVTPGELGGELELDGASLGSCLESGRARTEVERDLRVGQGLGIRGTPTFVLGGRTYPGGIPQDVLAAALNRDGGQ